MTRGGQTSPQHLLLQMASCSPPPSGLCLPFPRMLLLASAALHHSALVFFFLAVQNYSLSL